MPNLFVGRLNQDQLLDAFRKGITPQQVVRFLEDHAHPKVWKKIPVNVEDQIYLWYRERELVVSDNVDVYTDFVDVEEYNAWAEFADKNEILKGQYVDNKKDWSYKYGEWKHILHIGTKITGNSEAPKFQSPGFWLSPKLNRLNVMFDTLSVNSLL